MVHSELTLEAIYLTNSLSQREPFRLTTHPGLTPKMFSFLAQLQKENCIPQGRSESNLWL